MKPINKIKEEYKKRVDEIFEPIEDDKCEDCEVNFDVTKNQIKDIFHTYTEAIVHQALAEEREKVHRLVKLYGTPNCDYLHHNKKQQHEGGEICPVVTEITDLLSFLDKPDK